MTRMCLALSLLLLFSSTADGPARPSMVGIRFDANAEYDRVTLLLGESVDLQRLSPSGPELLVEIAARAPVFEPYVEEQLATLGMRISKLGSGSLLAARRDERSVRIFQLRNTSSFRRDVLLVIDLFKQPSADDLSIPNHALPVPLAGWLGLPARKGPAPRTQPMLPPVCAGPRGPGQVPSGCAPASLGSRPR